MCGLTGIVNLDFSKINQDILIEMTNQLAHRGPDGFGTEIVNNVGFGHRRLSILDLSRNGAQPMYSAKQNWLVVFNGCIYNFNELKRDLEKRGHKFNSTTDTEVIVNMIQFLIEEGNHQECKLSILKRLTKILDGTWACIIFFEDEPDKLYFIKNENPLLIGRKKGNVIFTSEPSGFMNMVDNYILLREKTYGYIDNSGNKEIYGEYKELPLLKLNDNDININNDTNNNIVNDIKNDDINKHIIIIINFKIYLVLIVWA
mgnify:CR=1 FL=1